MAKLAAGDELRRGRSPAVEPMLRITPWRRSTIAGTTACVIW
jgi:hypothetical protein